MRNPIAEYSGYLRGFEIHGVFCTIDQISDTPEEPEKSAYYLEAPENLEPMCPMPIMARYASGLDLAIWTFRFHFNKRFDEFQILRKAVRTYSDVFHLYIHFIDRNRGFRTAVNHRPNFGVFFSMDHYADYVRRLSLLRIHDI